MADEPRLPTADTVAEAHDEHDLAEVERIRTLDAFVSDGFTADMADMAADAWRRAYQHGQQLPTITGRPALQDVNSR